MSQTHTYAEIANDFALWAEFVDADGTMSKEEFDAMGEAEKIALQVEAFGSEAVSYTLNDQGQHQVRQFITNKGKADLNADAWFDARKCD